MKGRGLGSEGYWLGSIGACRSVGADHDGGQRVSETGGRLGELSPNAFETFSSAQVGHENQLTRALLVLLRLSPMAHQVWLRQLGVADYGFAELSEPTVAFQTGRVPNVDPETDGIRGVSVFISREEPQNRGPISASDRGQIPDALLTYETQEGRIVVVVESKVSGEADEWQAREINLGPIEPTWSPPEPVELRWHSLIDDLWSLVDRHLVSATDRRLLLDFFDYVDLHYRQVGPFRTLKRCAGVRERVLRRCRALLSEATGLEAQEPRHGLGPYVEVTGAPGSLARRVFLDNEQIPGQLRLSLWPADTSSQARAFYGDPEASQRLLDLRDDAGWELVPNMHFGHFQRGYAWVPLPDALDVGAYVRFWQENTDVLGVVRRPPEEPDWDSLLSRLKAEGIIAGRDDFDADFTNTGRNYADVRPGLQLYREWPMPEAIELDEGPALLQQVRESYEKGLQAIGGTNEV